MPRRLRRGEVRLLPGRGIGARQRAATTGATSSSTSSSASSGAGGGGSCDASHPVQCPARHGAKANCWTAATACATVVHCPWGDASCSEGKVVDCAAKKCVAPVGDYESSDAACANGQDDDGNGYADCKDFRCAGNPAVTVCSGETSDDACSNGQDDDGNGAKDCKDIMCLISPSVTVCGASERDDATCSNNADDNGNGYIDCKDLSCRGSPFVSVCK